MASASDQSILKGVDLNNADQIRKIMRGLQYYLTHSILSLTSEHLRDLSEEEASLICMIMASIRLHAQRYPLLLEASLRFVSEQYRDNKGVQSAAVQFATLADGPVYTAPNLHLEAYKEAEESMEYIRGPYDVLRIRQRATELAPGAFVQQIYSTSRATQVEAMVASGSGDVRDIPPSVQFKPRAAVDGPKTLNTGRCERCIGSNATCDRKEPHCTECRFTWAKCFYKTPSSGIVEEPAAAIPEPAGQVAAVPAASNAAAPQAMAPKAAAAKPTINKPAESKPVGIKGGPATKPGAAKPTASKPPAKVLPPKAAAKAAAPKAAPKAIAPKPEPKAISPKPASAKHLPPPSDRVTRSIAKSTIPDTEGSSRLPGASQSDGKKRKQPAPGDIDESMGPRPSKMTKVDVATEPQPESRKRKQEADNNGESSSAQQSKKIKSDDSDDSPPVNSGSSPCSGTKASSSASSAVANDDSEAATRPAARGRPEKKHDGERCCNTCQAWKPIAEFQLKRYSKIPGEQVGYCSRCQASKQAKNKAKADAKRASAENDQNAEGEKSGDAEGSKGAEAKGKKSAETKGKTSAEAKGKTSAEAKGKTSAEAKGKKSAEAKGKKGAKAEGEKTGDTDGEKIGDDHELDGIASPNKPAVDTQG